MKNLFRYLTLLPVCLVLFNQASGKISRHLPVSFSVYIKAKTVAYFSDESVGYTAVSLTTPGEKDTVFFSDSTGVFPAIRLNRKKTYTLSFSGKNLLTKSVAVDLTSVPDSSTNAHEDVIEMMVKMVDRRWLVNCDEASVRALEQAVHSTWHYDVKSGSSQWDVNAFQRIQKMIEACMAE